MTRKLRLTGRQQFTSPAVYYTKLVINDVILVRDAEAPALLSVRNYDLTPDIQVFTELFGSEDANFDLTTAGNGTHPLGPSDLNLLSLPEEDTDGFVGPADANYVHNQSPAAISWDVTHNLQKMPSVTVLDSAGSEVVGSIDYVSSSRVILTFSAAFSGTAIFN